MMGQTQTIISSAVPMMPPVLQAIPPPIPTQNPMRMPPNIIPQQPPPTNVQPPPIRTGKLNYSFQN